MYMPAEMKEIRNGRILEESTVIDLFKSERLEVKSEEPISPQDNRTFTQSNAHTDSVRGNVDPTQHSQTKQDDFSNGRSIGNSNTKGTTVSDKDQTMNNKGVACHRCQTCGSKDNGRAMKVEHQEPESEDKKQINPTVSLKEPERPQGDLLKKYDFIKSIINKRYTEKYDDLAKKLTEHTDNEANTSESLLPEAEWSTDEHCRVSESESLDAQKETEDDDIMILLSDSDSEGSILEVPIAPKPQPPIIHLRDSDEEYQSDDERLDKTEKQSNTKSRSSNSESSQNQEEQNNDMQWVENSEDYSTTPWDVNNIDGGDMMLNCMEIQKSASSIKQIRDMSKHAENEQITSKAKIESNKNANNYTINRTTFLSPKVNQPTPSSSGTKEQDKTADTVMFNNLPLRGSMAPGQQESQLRKKRPYESDEQSPNRSKQQKQVFDQFLVPAAKIGNNVGKEFTERIDDSRMSFNEMQRLEAFDMDRVLGGMSRDPRLWAILDEDLMPCPRRQRFWNVRCTFCHEEGHVRQNCQAPRKPPNCRICGITGHSDIRCPQKMCLTCGKKQGTFRKTCESCRILYCNMCKAIGHKISGCPDLWRRFHQTTRRVELNVPVNPAEVMKPPNLLVCCNCTKRGHDASTCREFRWSQHFATPAYVSSYTEGPRYAYPINLERLTQSPPENNPVPTTSTARPPTEKPSTSESTNKCKLLYSIGKYDGEKRNEINVKISKREKDYDIHDVKVGGLKPVFLKSLEGILSFEVKIVCAEDGTVVLTIIASSEHTQLLYTLIRHWLQLNYKDKLNGMNVCLPKKKIAMLSLLNSKIPELAELFEPFEVWSEVRKVKNEIMSTKDSVTKQKLNKTLSGLLSKLVRVFQTKPTVCNPLTRVKEVIAALEKSNLQNVDASLYLKIVILYNKIFRPYLPPFLDKLIRKDSASSGKYSQRKYARFVEQFKQHNYDLARQNKEQIVLRHYTPASFTEKGVATVENLPDDIDDYQASSNSPETQENLITDETPMTSAPPPVVPEQLNSAPMTRSQTNQKHDIQNSIVETDQSSQDDSTSGSQSQNSNDSSNPEAESSAKQTSKSKKKSKASVVEPETGLEEEAKELIQTALEFGIPYITKPAMEIEKRLKDQSIEEKHIQMLRKLIKLEKRHQKKVNTVLMK